MNNFLTQNKCENQFSVYQLYYGFAYLKLKLQETIKKTQQMQSCRVFPNL
jgi:hypothetical protein